MLTNLGIELNNLNENIIIKLLTRQLEFYQSSFTYNTTIQQIEILETLLKNYFNNEKPLQRAIALIDLAKLIRISKPANIAKPATPKKQKTNYSVSDDMSQVFASQLNISFMSEETEATREAYDMCMDEDDCEMDRSPLDLLEEAIDLLSQVKQCGVDDNEVAFEMILDDVLAGAYLWKSIVKRELFATAQAVQSQIDSLNSSILNLRLEANEDGDAIGFECMLKALEIWSHLISKCDRKCKHLCGETGFDKCDKCHKCFRNLFCTIQHLQIMVDYLHLHNYVSLEIFVLDRMISLLSTMCSAGHLSWCREYRLLCLCWSASAYYKFGNIGESKKVFMELEPILLASTPTISQHVAKHIHILYAQYQAFTNEKQGIETLLSFKKELEKNKNNKWENVYLMAKVKIALARIQIEAPHTLQQIGDIDLDIDPQTLAKDALLRFTSLIDKLNQQFTFKNDLENNKHTSLTYNSFINALPNTKFQFLAASSKQYLSTHHPQSNIHENHTKMFYHYPSEFRLIADFLKCIQILGRYLSIIHEPKHSLYHFENGKKATHNLVVQQQQEIFLIDLAKIQSKQENWHEYDCYLKKFNEISMLSTIKLSASLRRRIYGSLCKITPYADDYDCGIKNILYIECVADELRYKCKYMDAMAEYDKSLSIIDSFFAAKSRKIGNDFLPIARLQCSLQRKYAVCLLNLRQPNSLQQCLKICFEILKEKAILNDLMIAKIKLYIGQCLILQLQSECNNILQIIWKGNAETIELESILSCKMNMNMNVEDKYLINDEIEAVICCRQHLLQCLLILLHLKTVNPSLIKRVSFALSYIYGETNIKWSTMFLNMCQSANTRQAAMKQYRKQLNVIKQQWQQFKSARKEFNINVDAKGNGNINVSIKDLEISMKKLKLNKKNNNNAFNKNDYLQNEEYESLYTRFYHKLLSVSYYNKNENENENEFDYNDYKCCSKIMQLICDKFYCQTVEYLQYSWNCLSIEVDHLLQTMLICVINPSSTSRKTATEIVIVNVAINKNSNANNESNEIKDEENDDATYDNIMRGFDAFLQEANESTHCGKKCVSKDEIKLWWQNRYKLDEKLKTHLDEIEFNILGIFRCLFIPHFRHKQSKKLMQSSCQALVTAINEYLLKKTNAKYLSTCFVLKSKARSCKMILFAKLLQLMLVRECCDDEIKRGLSAIFCICENYLLNKLLDTVKQHIQSINKKFIMISKLNISDFDPLIMSIGDTLAHLPWENIPILQFCLPSICRIPCFEFAALRVLQYKNYKNNNAQNENRYYFIINPKGDLKKSQQRFDRLLNEEWNGIRGIEPTFDEFRYGLEENNVFLYVGHNGGEEFVNCHKLQTFNIKAIAFLMGCSSGLLKKRGIFESDGIANYYMIACCPIVIANLWDVTDKDIDQFSCQMLRKCMLKPAEQIIDIAKAVNISRCVCKLKYLNGAAPICYGIPFHLIHGIYV